jgi:hypothetical protein
MKEPILNSLTLVLLCASVVPQTAVSQNTASTSSNAGVQASATASHQAHDSSFRVAEGSVFHVVLAQNLDAKKNKTGDAVTTTIVEDLRSNGEVMIPKNSRVVGHITQIQSHSKEHPQSQIAITFDRLLIKDGDEISLSASIQAVAAPETAPSNNSEQSGTGYGEMGGSMGGTMAGSGGRGSSPSSYPSGGAGRGSSGGVAGTATGAVGSAGRTADQATGRYSRGLSAATQGVVGLKDLSLSTQGEASEGSVITSDHQNVHLEHGTQFVLRVKSK